MTVVYGFSGFMLLGCGLGWIGKLLGLLVLLIQWRVIWINPTPQPRYLHLDYLNKKWFLILKDGRTQLFTKHRVLLDAGLFFIVRLSSEESYKIVVVFFDQISPDHYRVLRILEKIN